VAEPEYRTAAPSVKDRYLGPTPLRALLPTAAEMPDATRGVFAQLANDDDQR
jgi:hypothetical protein